MRDVILKACIPEQKLLTVKVIKEALGLGLKEAKELVDAIPSKIAKEVTDEEAGNLIKVFVKEGMKIEVRDTLTNKLVYPINQKVETMEAMTEVLKGHTATDIETPRYWIMGTPDRGDDTYAILKDKDPLIQSKSSVSVNTIEDPSLLLWISDDHKISAISTENNISLINLITKNWTELELPWKPEDKQLIWAWNDHVLYRRILTFYDSENKCCFDGNGERDGNYYDNYAPFEGEWPQWAKNALEELED